MISRALLVASFAIAMAKPSSSRIDPRPFLTNMDEPDDLPHIVIEMPPRGEGADAARAMGEGFVAQLANPGVDPDEDPNLNLKVGCLLAAGFAFIIIVILWLLV